MNIKPGMACRLRSSCSAVFSLRSDKLLDQLRKRICYLHYSLRTEEAYVYRVRFASVLTA